MSRIAQRKAQHLASAGAAQGLHKVQHMSCAWRSELSVGQAVHIKRCRLLLCCRVDL